MKRRISLISLIAVTGVIANPAKAENYISPKDSTKVIDIEEVVVIATPKENNRLRQQPVAATSLSQMICEIMWSTRSNRSRLLFRICLYPIMVRN